MVSFQKNLMLSFLTSKIKDQLLNLSLPPWPVSDEPLDEMEFLELQGLTICHNLSWPVHIVKIALKAG